MNIIICDDMPKDAEKLIRLLSQTCAEADMAVFKCGADVLEYVRSGAVADICFLDIIMPEMNGVELAEKLRESGYKGAIVFLTTSNEYAHESYRVEAFDYLIKPPSPEAVLAVLQKLETVRLSDDTEGITLKVFGVARKILFREIKYAEVKNHKVYILLMDGGRVDVNAPLSGIAPQLLRDNRFAQCHASYIVNMDAISSISGSEIIMRGGARISVSKKYADTKHKYLSRALASR